MLARHGRSADCGFRSAESRATRPLTLGDLRRFVAGADVFSRQSDGTTIAAQYAHLGLTDHGLAKARDWPVSVSVASAGEWGRNENIRTVDVKEFGEWGTPAEETCRRPNGENVHRGLPVVNGRNRGNRWRGASQFIANRVDSLESGWSLAGFHRQNHSFLGTFGEGCNKLRCAPAGVGLGRARSGRNGSAIRDATPIAIPLRSDFANHPRGV